MLLLVILCSLISESLSSRHNQISLCNMTLDVYVMREVIKNIHIIFQNSHQNVKKIDHYRKKESEERACNFYDQYRFKYNIHPSSSLKAVYHDLSINYCINFCTAVVVSKVIQKTNDIGSSYSRDKFHGITNYVEQSQPKCHKKAEIYSGMY